MSTNQAQKKERIHEIYRLLLTGTNRRSIIRYAKIKEWNVSERTIDGYIKEAMEELTTTLNIDRERKQRSHNTASTTSTTAHTPSTTSRLALQYSKRATNSTDSRKTT